MKFEWDENKNKSNIENHKVSFEQVLFACYCERGKDELNEDILRIISARKATDKERRLFYE